MEITKKEKETETLDLNILFQVLVTGNIAQLTAKQKLDYVSNLTESLGLNPLTRPFQFIVFKGKEILYATKDCTDQLRKIYQVSVLDCTITFQEKVIIATAKVQDKHGKIDIATGVVENVSSPADYANAIMKAETKAKRRATLSICGLGILDESELDTMEKNITPVQNKLETIIKNVPVIDVDPFDGKQHKFQYIIDLTDEELNKDIERKTKVINYCYCLKKDENIEFCEIENEKIILVLPNQDPKLKFFYKGVINE